MFLGALYKIDFAVRSLTTMLHSKGEFLLPEKWIGHAPRMPWYQLLPASEELPLCRNCHACVLIHLERLKAT